MHKPAIGYPKRSDQRGCACKGGGTDGRMQPARASGKAYETYLMTLSQSISGAVGVAEGQLWRSLGTCVTAD